MPTDYKCTHCMLRFSTGPYHYHCFDSGYSGRCLLVCSACGTQHALEAALRNRGSEYDYFYSLTVESLPATARQKVIQILRAANKELTLAGTLELVRHPPFLLYPCVSEPVVERLKSGLLALDVSFRTEVVKQESNSMFGPLLCDLLHYFPGPQYSATAEKMLVSKDVLRLEKEGEHTFQYLHCQHCNIKGSLVYDLPQGATRCPACKSDSLIVEQFWVT